MTEVDPALAGLHIVGWAGGRVVVDEVLPHGVDVDDLLAEHGWRATDVRETTGRLGVDLAAHFDLGPHPVVPRPPRRGVVDEGVDPEGANVLRRQRVAAYVFASSDRGWLMCELSGRTRSPGLWTLPGGGMDPGETAAEAVHREVWEETAQEVELGELVAVATFSWVGRWGGRAPLGTVQDHHAVRLVHVGRCARPSEPRVLEVGGSTSAARWVTDMELAQLPVVDSWAQILPAVTGVVPSSW